MVVVCTHAPERADEMMKCASMKSYSFSPNYQDTHYLVRRLQVGMYLPHCGLKSLQEQALLAFG